MNQREQNILACFSGYCGQTFTEPLPPTIRAALDRVVYWEQTTGGLFGPKYLQRGQEAIPEIVPLLRPHVVIRIVAWSEENLPSWEDFQQRFE